MVTFDEQAILDNGAYIYAQRAEIERIADAVCEQGFDSIYFTSSGGSLAMMQPFDYMISVMLDIPVQSQISADLLTAGNRRIGKGTLAFMAFEIGRHPKRRSPRPRKVKEAGCTIISTLGKDGSPLGDLSDYGVVYKNGRPMELVLYLLIGKILKNKGFFDDYDRFADELVNLPAALVSVGQGRRRDGARLCAQAPERPVSDLDWLG